MNEMDLKVKGPGDFLLLFSYFHRDAILKTKLMKSFQIFTSFQKFSYFNDFKPYYYGGYSETLDANISMLSPEVLLIDEEVGLSSEREEKTKIWISLQENYVKEINQVLESNPSSEDIELIESISEFAKKHQSNEIIQFCYYFFPELTTESVIIDYINGLSPKLLKRTIQEFLATIEPHFALEFILMKIKLLIEQSQLNDQDIDLMELIVQEICIVEKNNLDILETVENDFKSLIENTKDEVYKKGLQRIYFSLKINPAIPMPFKLKVQFVLFLLKYEVQYQDSRMEVLFDAFKQSHISFNTFQIGIDD